MVLAARGRIPGRVRASGDIIISNNFGCGRGGCWHGVRRTALGRRALALLLLPRLPRRIAKRLRILPTSAETRNTGKACDQNELVPRQIHLVDLQQKILRAQYVQSGGKPRLRQ